MRFITRNESVKLTGIQVRNFKRLTDTGLLPLDTNVVLIGPNNSGKTTLLQAFYIWMLGVHRWAERKQNGGRTSIKSSTKQSGKSRIGVPINRKDLFAVPAPRARLLWRNLFVRQSEREGGKMIGTRNINIEITVQGLHDGQAWSCTMEFEFQNDEVMYCRPLGDETNNVLLSDPDILQRLQVAFLPPMSGLVTEEFKILPATIQVKIGEGSTAEVLRNLCYQVLHPEVRDISGSDPAEDWKSIVTLIKKLFLVELTAPSLTERGAVSLGYKDENGYILDLSSSGRGMQQVLLLLTYLYSNPGSVLLLDEPDAHLEILRQREIYRELTELAGRQNSQIIAASHSEIILEEAADKDIVLAFTGLKPHRINDRGTQLKKSLKDFSYTHYFNAERSGWVLYLEGSTDLAILRKLAETLNHPVNKVLENVFVHYVSSNQPQIVRNHFYGLRDAIPNLKGIAIFDRIEAPEEQESALWLLKWEKREIENYFFKPDLLLSFARGELPEYMRDGIVPDLFTSAQVQRQEQAMDQSLKALVPPIALSDLNFTYWNERKASEEIEQIFTQYYKILKQPNQMTKNKFVNIASLLPADQIDPEVIIKLDAIYELASSISIETIG